MMGSGSILLCEILDSIGMQEEISFKKSGS